MHGGMNEELWLSHSDDVQPQAELQRRIWEALRSETRFDTADVTVWVEDFVVTLRGSVTSDQARIGVKDATQHVDGVHAVVDELRVAAV